MNGGVAYIFGMPEILAEYWGCFPDPKRFMGWHHRNKPCPGARFWGRSWEGIVAFSKGTPRFYADPIREPYTAGYTRLLGKTRVATPGRFGDQQTVYTNHGGAWPRDILIGPAVAGGLGRVEGLGHPTQKPLWLLERLILSCTREGDVVADLFSGSGSTAAAAQSLNRRWIAIERDPAYIEMILKRMTSLAG
jgi:hypothetical protein